MRRALLVAYVAACGNAPAHHFDAPVIDSPVIDGSAAENVVTLTWYSNLAVPDFIAYRNGSDGLWRTPTTNETSSGPEYLLQVANDYIVVMVCDDGGSGSAFDAEEAGFTFSGDGSAVSDGCSVTTTAPSGTPTTITGTMVQPGTVQIGGVGSCSPTGPWTYTIATTAGTYDILAIDTSNRAVWIGGDDGVPFSGSAIGPSIDTGSGAPLASEPLTITGLGASTLLVEDYLDPNLVSSGSAAVALTMPVSEVTPNTPQEFDLFVTDAVGHRSALSGTEGQTQPRDTYNLLPAFATGTIEGLTASWEQLPSSTYTEILNLAQSADGTQQQNVSMSPSWIAAREANSLTFDTTAPGYLSAWNLDVATAQVELDMMLLDPAPSSTVPVGTLYESAVGSHIYLVEKRHRALVGLPMRPSNQ
jgi:hypothetical protein